MAIPKILGIETEYGILVRGTDESNPIAASSLLINAYLNADREGPAPRVGWDFEDESPDHDQRGFTPVGAMPPEVETHLVNAVLTNGAPLLRRSRPSRDQHPQSAQILSTLFCTTVPQS